jgi:myo-inositol-1-phosphate synthase
VIDVISWLTLVATDKEVSGSIKPFQEYMLKDLDEQMSVTIIIARKIARMTLWDKTY